MIANAIVRPKEFMNRPTMPPMNATGRKTATSESVVARTARPISFVASIAAWNGMTFFSSMNRKMFSRTTIASSMTMPTASVSARSVRTFSVKPIAYMRANVEMMDVGIAIAAMSVERRFPRKRRTTRAARKPPRTRCSWTVSTAALMNCDWSRTISVE